MGDRFPAMAVSLRMGTGEEIDLAREETAARSLEVVLPPDFGEVLVEIPWHLPPRLGLGVSVPI